MPYFVFFVKAELEDKSCNSSFIQMLTRLILSILRINQATDYPQHVYICINTKLTIWYKVWYKEKWVESWIKF